MKIDTLKARRGLRTKSGGLNRTSLHSSIVSPFSQMLNIEETEHSVYKMELEQLRSEIEEAGSALDKVPTLKEFNKFRDLIGVLTQKVSKEAFKLKTIGLYSRNKHQIIYTINAELSELYKLVMSEQKNRIAIASKVIRLNGLVVDVLS